MPNALLEVDESLLKRSLMLPEFKEEGEEFDRLLKTLETKPVPSVVFRPNPGLCIKTKTDTGDKIFVNLCHTTEIPPPEEISDEKFYKILDEDPPNWCIPMSIGNERLETDKSGVQCQTYDVAINTKFFDLCQEKHHFFAFAILAILSAIGEKYNKVIDTHYVVLKNRKVVGKLQDHRAMKREPKYSNTNSTPKLLIEEVSQKSGPGPLIEKISERSGSKARIKEISEKLEPVGNGKPMEEGPGNKNEVEDNSQYVIFKKPKEGKTEKLIGYFKLPSQCPESDIRADVGEDRIVIDAKGFNYLIDVCVPFSVDQSTTTASLDPVLNILRLDMPVIST